MGEPASPIDVEGPRHTASVRTTRRSTVERDGRCRPLPVGGRRLQRLGTQAEDPLGPGGGDPGDAHESGRFALRGWEVSHMRDFFRSVVRSPFGQPGGDDRSLRVGEVPAVQIVGDDVLEHGAFDDCTSRRAAERPVVGMA